MKPRQQSGFALITAIIILVVLAALGAFAASFVPMQQLGSAADIQGARVLLAARSGLEWGAYQVTQGGPSCAASTSNTFAATAASLKGITVTVTCDSAKAPLYKITATACNQPSGGACPNTTSPNVSYVERQVEMIVQSP